MLHRLEQRSGLQTGWRLLLPVKCRAYCGWMLTKAVQQMVEGLQRKGRVQGFKRFSDGAAGQQALEHLPQPRRRHGMAGQHVG